MFFKTATSKLHAVPNPGRERVIRDAPLNVPRSLAHRGISDPHFPGCMYRLTKRVQKHFEEVKLCVKQPVYGEIISEILIITSNERSITNPLSTSTASLLHSLSFATASSRPSLWATVSVRWHPTQASGGYRARLFLLVCIYRSTFTILH